MKAFQGTIVTNTETIPTDPVFPAFPANSVLVFSSKGQSNEEGGWNLANDGAMPASDYLPMPAVQMAVVDEPTFADYELTFNNKYKPYNEYRGFHLQIARTWQNHYSDGPLYVLKDGLGGTNIDPFINRRYGEADDALGTNGLRINSMFRYLIRPRINEFLSAGKRPFVWVFFGQGENDSFVSRVDFYAYKFDIWVDTWKEIYGANVPFIIMTIIETDANDVRINDIFRAKALIEPNMIVIETGDLPDKGDNLHFSSEGYDTLGDRVIEAMKQLTPVEITEPFDYLPDTMTLLTVNKSGLDLTITADIEDGDIETIPEDLIFNIYDGTSLIGSVGSHNSDANVNVVKANDSYTVTIQNFTVTSGFKNITITSLDAATNESPKSNVIQITV